jgi:hypothetical protein
VTNPQKQKGDAAELEIAGIVSDLLGFRVRRKLGAGRTDDTGDLDGIPDTTVQVKNWANTTAAINAAMNELPIQQANAGTTHGVAFIRRPGGRWIAVMTVEGWATYAREAS